MVGGLDRVAGDLGGVAGGCGGVACDRGEDSQEVFFQPGPSGAGAFGETLDSVSGGDL